MVRISIGKLRGLQQCATARGAFSILSIDHRRHLRQLLQPHAPDSVSATELTAFKRQVIERLASSASAVTLDPEFGAAQCIAQNVLPGAIGLLASLQATGTINEAGAYPSRLLPGWSVEKSKRMGANAAKLMVYYHPESANADQVEQLVASVATECRSHDILFCLEILSRPSGYVAQQIPTTEERHSTLIESVRRLVCPGVDLLQVEFPVDVKAEPQETRWADACNTLSAFCPAPWVLLSAATDYDLFIRQVMVACRAGASGVAVGRAVWKEALEMATPGRLSFLQSQGRMRMSRITALCDAWARPWTDFYCGPEVNEEWYRNY